MLPYIFTPNKLIFKFKNLKKKKRSPYNHKNHFNFIIDSILQNILKLILFITFAQGSWSGKTPLTLMKLAQKCPDEPRTQIWMFPSFKGWKKKFGTKDESFAQKWRGNKKRMKIKSLLWKLWGKKPQEHLYEGWKKKKKMYCSPSLEELVHNNGE